MKLSQILLAGLVAISTTTWALGSHCCKKSAASTAQKGQAPDTALAAQKDKGCLKRNTVDCPKSGKVNCPLTGSKGCPMERGWPLAIQAWTFHHVTLFEAIDNAKKLGLRYMELIPTQAVSPEMKNVKFDVNASLSLIAKVKMKMEEAGVQPIAMGVVRLPADETQCRKVFDFAKVMGITTLCAEPPEDALPMIDKLANEYRINVAIHNHPKPSHYWSPETVLAAVKDCSPRIGACADTGHWVRSGLDPVECLKKLEGRVLWSHFKDLNERSPKAHDVVWGTGVCGARAMLAELKRQGYTGGISLEYEYNWGKAMPELARCVEFYRKTMAELFGKGKYPCGDK